MRSRVHLVRVADQSVSYQQSEGYERENEARSFDGVVMKAGKDKCIWDFRGIPVDGRVGGWLADGERNCMTGELNYAGLGEIVGIGDAAATAVFWVSFCSYGASERDCIGV
ncbi:hypothetical protein R1sor_017480 [Riccia sorocarpa]|uniref:Uncharacterized protein n=1 Tax=Riccia sorocarpa TaxID=122646 RepID=A0ABD3I7C0_9MARC